MGARQSKPRLRRSRGFSSLRKRQGPEGSNSPEPLPTERVHQPASPVGRYPDKNCKYCQKSDKYDSLPGKEMHTKNDGSCERIFGAGQQADEKTTCLKELLTYSDLKVEIPQTPDCRRLADIDKSKSLPPQSKSPGDDCRKLSEKEDEWTITLYEIDKLSRNVPREGMVRLMSSIYDAVDNKVKATPHGRKTVRVRLSVTPEPRHQTSKLQRNYSTKDPSSLLQDPDSCKCQDCPKTEPSTRRISNNWYVRRHGSDVSPTRLHFDTRLTDSPNLRRTFNPRQYHTARLTKQASMPRNGYAAGEENKDRRQHYSRLEGVENSRESRLPEKGQKCTFAGNATELHRRLSDTKHKNKTNRPQTSTKSEELKAGKSTCAKRRLRHHDNDHRNVMLRTRRKDSRFASPYDQHFQEAMYIRLLELQRQGAHEARRATGLRGDSDEADESESECDLYEKKNLTHESENVVRENIYDDVTQQVTVNNATSNEHGTDEARTEVWGNMAPSSVSTPVTKVHHHHHYHHGVSPGSIMPALCSTDAAVREAEIASSQSTQSPQSSSATPQPRAADTPQLFHHYHHHYHHTDC